MNPKFMFSSIVLITSTLLNACQTQVPSTSTTPPLQTNPATVVPPNVVAPMTNQSNYPVAKVLKATSQVVGQAGGAGSSGVRVGAGASGGSGGGVFGGVGFSVDLGTLMGLFGGNKAPTTTQVLWVYELQDLQSKQVYQSTPISKEMMIQSCVRYRAIPNSQQAEVLNLEAC